MRASLDLTVETKPVNERDPMTGAEVVQLRGRLMRLTEQLVQEYRERLAAGTVIRVVAMARDELRLSGVRAGLEPAVEAMARQRLQQRVRTVA